eukprot:TRINITY_DN7717_c0_g1_i3.p1 TRINITY_DN7717_c0_g1~~TRINITY_DN7717_c0_g1_i3.p1  ORF type:complete len:1763 (-),score=251.57 TRINITY_DN7717_c0_g1_i3:73-5361(-)
MSAWLLRRDSPCTLLNCWQCWCSALPSRTSFGMQKVLVSAQKRHAANVAVTTLRAWHKSVSDCLAAARASAALHSRMTASLQATSLWLRRLQASCTVFDCWNCWRSTLQSHAVIGARRVLISVQSQHTANMATIVLKAWNSWVSSLQAGALAFTKLRRGWRAALDRRVADACILVFKAWRRSHDESALLRRAANARKILSSSLQLQSEGISRAILRCWCRMTCERKQTRETFSGLSKRIAVATHQQTTSLLTAWHMLALERKTVLMLPRVAAQAAAMLQARHRSQLCSSALVAWKVAARENKTFERLERCTRAVTLLLDSHRAMHRANCFKFWQQFALEEKALRRKPSELTRLLEIASRKRRLTFNAWCAVLQRSKMMCKQFDSMAHALDLALNRYEPEYRAFAFEKWQCILLLGRAQRQVAESVLPVFRLWQHLVFQGRASLPRPATALVASMLDRRAAEGTVQVLRSWHGLALQARASLPRHAAAVLTSTLDRSAAEGALQVLRSWRDHIVRARASIRRHAAVVLATTLDRHAAEGALQVLRSWCDHVVRTRASLPRHAAALLASMLDRQALEGALQVLRSWHDTVLRARVSTRRHAAVVLATTLDRHAAEGAVQVLRSWHDYVMQTRASLPRHAAALLASMLDRQALEGALQVLRSWHDAVLRARASTPRYAAVVLTTTLDRHAAEGAVQVLRSWHDHVMRTRASLPRHAAVLLASMLDRQAAEGALQVIRSWRDTVLRARASTRRHAAVVLTSTLDRHAAEDALQVLRSWRDNVVRTRALLPRRATPVLSSVLDRHAAEGMLQVLRSWHDNVVHTGAALPRRATRVISSMMGRQAVEGTLQALRIWHHAVWCARVSLPRYARPVLLSMLQRHAMDIASVVFGSWHAVVSHGRASLHKHRRATNVLIVVLEQRAATAVQAALKSWQYATWQRAQRRRPQVACSALVSLFEDRESILILHLVLKAWRQKATAIVANSRLVTRARRAHTADICLFAFCSWCWATRSVVGARAAGYSAMRMRSVALRQFTFLAWHGRVSATPLIAMERAVASAAKQRNMFSSAGQQLRRLMLAAWKADAMVSRSRRLMCSLLPMACREQAVWRANEVLHHWALTVALARSRWAPKKQLRINAFCQVQVRALQILHAWARLVEARQLSRRVTAWKRSAAQLCSTFDLLRTQQDAILVGTAWACWWSETKQMRSTTKIMLATFRYMDFERLLCCQGALASWAISVQEAKHAAFQHHLVEQVLESIAKVSVQVSKPVHFSALLLNVAWRLWNSVLARRKKNRAWAKFARHARKRRLRSSIAAAAWSSWKYAAVLSERARCRGVQGLHAAEVEALRETWLAWKAKFQKSTLKRAAASRLSRALEMVLKRRSRVSLHRLGRPVNYYWRSLAYSQQELAAQRESQLQAGLAKKNLATCHRAWSVFTSTTRLRRFSQKMVLKSRSESTSSLVAISLEVWRHFKSQEIRLRRVANLLVGVEAFCQGATLRALLFGWLGCVQLHRGRTLCEKSSTVLLRSWVRGVQDTTLVMSFKRWQQHRQLPRQARRLAVQHNQALLPAVVQDWHNLCTENKVRRWQHITRERLFTHNWHTHLLTLVFDALHIEVLRDQLRRSSEISEGMREVINKMKAEQLQLEHEACTRDVSRMQLEKDLLAQQKQVRRLQQQNRATEARLREFVTCGTACGRQPKLAALPSCKADAEPITQEAMIAWTDKASPHQQLLKMLQCQGKIEQQLQQDQASNCSYKHGTALQKHCPSTYH